MDADSTSDAVRTQSFSTSLRGYDRDEVERFRDEMASHLASLEAQLLDAERKLTQLGIDDVSDLGDELTKVGADITAILDEARRAATDMRARAASDADAWRAAAHAEVAAIRSDAQAGVEHLRSHAWTEGTDMLDLAREEAERIVAAGRQEVLFIRAEVEREVLRLTGEARREAEDLMRTARADSDRVIAEADAEAANIVATAQRSVEGAIERSRVLEARRSELLQEIDAARLSLDAIQAGDVEAAAVAPSEQERPEMGWHEAEDSSVRIVSSVPAQMTGPVDADELVAEVEQLRSARAEPATEVEPVAPPAADPVTEAFDGPDESKPVMAVGDVTPPLQAVEPDAPIAAVGDAGAEMEADVPAAAAHEEAAVEPAESPGTSQERERDAQQEPVEPSVVAPAEGDEPLSGLFAQLRQPAPPVVEPAAPEPAADAPPEPAEVVAEAVQPEPVPAPAMLTPAPAGEGAFELRDRLLLPIENRALRAVKRHLVELQNHVLEELRTASGPWTPDPDEFLGEMSDDIMVMRRDAHAAGGVAAAELTGRGPLEISAPPGNSATREFAESLIAAVGGAHQRAAQDQAGSRELASAVSRVFRAWRTDEAERRLRSAAYGAYHAGLIDGFAAAGVAAVTAVTMGRPCAECPAGAEWAPGAALPDGTTLPPAHLECGTTVIPAGMAG